jgi:isopentenyldiphosphate isomerase
VDYIFLIQADVETLPVPNEVKAVKYVSKDGLAKFLDECGMYIYFYV